MKASIANLAQALPTATSTISTLGARFTRHLKFFVLAGQKWIRILGYLRIVLHARQAATCDASRPCSDLARGAKKHSRTPRLAAVLR